jgi:hypothetical protein
MLHRFCRHNYLAQAEQGMRLKIWTDKCTTLPMHGLVLEMDDCEPIQLGTAFHTQLLFDVPAVRFDGIRLPPLRTVFTALAIDFAAICFIT